MKIAFATDDGKHVDTHFGYTESFDIYDISKEKYEKVQTRVVSCASEISENNRIDYRINIIVDCKLLFITQIGPAAAARVTRNKIMPIKVKEGTLIQEQLDRLLLLLQSKPPLWLAKALNSEKESKL
ncbi:NifB/NifX family molybdenum-iron cluster-binding protein [Niallia sp. HCP3S3_B10]|uniref:NifB/NifX family molybdenum-iron cluster-binding protein n=1 Tax=Niallia sp. HCP3S3_B10 TaxID=3438944 RepID=UPI003F88832E